MRFQFSRKSSRRHHIGRAHALAALMNAGAPTIIDEPEGPRFHWTAKDDRGVELHMIGKIAVEDPQLVIIYHVMPTSFDHQEA